MLCCCIPVLNPGNLVERQVAALMRQKELPDTFLIIDSSQNDSHVQTYRQLDAEILQIDKRDFNHGRTRNIALEKFHKSHHIIYLTQDSIPCDEHTFSAALQAFSDPTVGAVYGRQVPFSETGLIGKHARLFNYPPQSILKSLADREALGLKTPFISNSFSVFKTGLLREIGGFPADVILSEDTFAASRLLESGYKIQYAADAMVYHSHDYGPFEELSRYFDIGVFHAREDWVRKLFGAAEGEGRKFVISEITYLMNNAPWRIPEAIFRTGLKYIGFQLGLHEASLGTGLKRRLSMNKDFWQTRDN